MNNERNEMTPAQKRGLVVGRQYRYYSQVDQSNFEDGMMGNGLFPKNSIVILKRDDGTTSPEFSGDAWDGSDCAYASIDDIFPICEVDGNIVTLINHNGNLYEKEAFEQAIAGLKQYVVE